MTFNNLNDELLALVMSPAELGQHLDSRYVFSSFIVVLHFHLSVFFVI